MGVGEVGGGVVSVPDPALRRPVPLLPGDARAAGRELGALGFRLGEVRVTRSLGQRMSM